MTTTVTPGTSFISRYSILLFFILAMVLGTGMIYLVVRGIIPSGFALASVLSASIAGVIMTALEDGSAGLKLMWMRLLTWRVGIGYWLFALLFILPTIILGSMANSLFNGDPPTYENLKPSFDILLIFISFFIVSGLGQELGWTGFLMPRLQARFNALTSALLRAALVSIWHLPLLYYAREGLPALSDFPYSGWIAGYGFLPVLAITFALFQVPWAIFFTWTFNNTRGSLLLVAVLHASEVWTAVWMMRNGIGHDNLDNYWGYGAVLVITAIIVVIYNGEQNLSRKHHRITHQPPP